jgi:hypothetical protein
LKKKPDGKFLNRPEIGIAVLPCLLDAEQNTRPSDFGSGFNIIVDFIG